MRSCNGLMNHLHLEIQEVQEDGTTSTSFNFFQLLKSCQSLMTHLHAEVQEVEKIRLILLFSTFFNFLKVAKVSWHIFMQKLKKLRCWNLFNFFYLLSTSEKLWRPHVPKSRKCSRSCEVGTSSIFSTSYNIWKVAMASRSIFIQKFKKLRSWS